MKFRMTPVAAALTAMFAVPSIAMAEDAVVAAPTSESAPAAESAAAPAEKGVQLPAVKVVGQQDSPKADRVASPKYTQPLLDTPRTITVIKKEVLQQQAATTLSDALRNSTGITFQMGENGNSQSGDAIFMRGFDTQNSIFLDGIRDLGPAVRDTFNIEQIDIVKGAAGADNGRGATSGYINLSSKLPQADDFINASLSYGDNERRRVTADVNEKVGSSTAVRLNLMGQDGGVAGRDEIERAHWGIAPSVAFGLGTPTRAFVATQHIRQDNTPDGGVPTIGLKGYRFSNVTNSNVEAALAAAGITPAPVRRDNYYGLDSDFENIESNMYTAKFEHDLSTDTTIRNISRYGKVSQERVMTTPLQAPAVSDDPDTTGPLQPVVRTDPTTWDVGRSRQASFRTNEVLTNQTNFTTSFKTGFVEQDLSGGFEFVYESQFNPAYAAPTTPALPRANLYNPVSAATVPAFAKTGASTDGETITQAVYLFDTIKFGPQWLASAGVRFERYKTDYVSIAAPVAPATQGLATSLTASDNLFSWNAGLTFKPTTASSVYLSYANAMKPPGTDNFTLAAPTPNATTGAVNLNSDALDPQEAEIVELGTKWDFLEGRLAFAAAVFSGSNKNDLARADPTDATVIFQYGKREVKGVELSLSGQISPKWQVMANVAKQDTEVSDGVISNASPGTPSTQTGSAINFSPEWTVNLWTTYRPVQKLVLGGGFRYIDNQARSVNNNPNAPGTGGQVGQTGLYVAESYYTFDGMATYELTKKVGLQLNVYNLTDEEYVASYNNSGQRYNPGTPRSYLATVNLKF